MKKKLIILLLISNFSIAQTLEWANSYGAAGYDSAYGVTTDSNNNTLILGSFQETVDFDPGTGIVNLQSNGDNDIFIQKLDSEGNLIWVTSLGGADRDFANAISTDSQDNVIVVGAFSGTIDGDPGPGVSMITSVGKNDIFVLKLNGIGNFVWVKTIGTSDEDFGYSLVHDSSGNSYITGVYEESIGPPAPDNTSRNSTFVSKIFITKITSEGSTDWFQTIGGLGYDYGSGIDLDGDDFIYVNGRFQETVDFDPGSGVEERISIGGSDSYVLKLDTDGNFIWVQAFGSTLRDHATSIAVDSFGNVLTLGLFEDTIDLDPSSGDFNATSNGLDDFYVQKLDADGNFIWGKAVGGPSADIARSLTLDVNDNIYAVGYFFETTDFDPGSDIFALSSAGSADIFLLSLTSSGDFIDAEYIGGVGYDQAKAVAIDHFNNIIIAGYYSETVDFNPSNSTFNLSSNGFSDAFVIKLNKSILGISDLANELSFVAYPNPTNGQLTVKMGEVDGQIKVNLYTMLGQQISSYNVQQTNEFDLEISGATGVYFVEVITNTSSQTFRIIKN